MRDRGYDVRQGVLEERRLPLSLRKGVYYLVSIQRSHANNARDGFREGLKQVEEEMTGGWEQEIRVARLGRVELPAAQRSFGVSG